MTTTAQIADETEFNARANQKKKLAFLGGTVGHNDWRSGFIAALVSAGVPSDSLFNPVVKDWNPEAQVAEEQAKRDASHMVFYIADPMMGPGVLSSYSMVEATMALYDRPESTVVVFDCDGLDGHALKAMQQTQRVLVKRFPDANILGSRAEALSWLSGQLRTDFGRHGQF